MIEVAIRQILLANNSTVPSLADNRVFFGNRPQNERRAGIVLTKTSEVTYQTLNGKAGYSIGRMQLDCLAPTYPAVKELAKAAKDTIENFTLAGGGVVDETLIAYLEIEDEADIPMAPLLGEASPTYGVSLTCRFMTTEAEEAEAVTTSN